MLIVIKYILDVVLDDCFIFNIIIFHPLTFKEQLHSQRGVLSKTAMSVDMDTSILCDAGEDAHCRW